MNAIVNLSGRAWFFLFFTIYLALSLAAIAQYNFDISYFVGAGDAFVRADELQIPIHIRPMAAGYDGQFYYRLAIAPFDAARHAYGVVIDLPTIRMQRILYPLLAHFLSFGSVQMIPMVMWGINIAGLGLIGVFSARLSQHLKISGTAAWMIMVWPGLIITLSCDTTEITALSLLLAALCAYFADRIWLYAVLATLTSLTRETSILAFGGVLLWEMLAAWRAGSLRKHWLRILVCGIALIPFLIYRETLQSIDGGKAAMEFSKGNTGLPFVGAVRALEYAVFRAWVEVRQSGFNLADYRVFTRVSLIYEVAWLLGAGLCIAARLRQAWRLPGAAVLVSAWLPICALMILLNNTWGPWVEPRGFFRAFSEFYVLGSLIVASTKPPAWMRWYLIGGGALAGLMMYLPMLTHGF